MPQLPNFLPTTKNRIAEVREISDRIPNPAAEVWMKRQTKKNPTAKKRSGSSTAKRI